MNNHTSFFDSTLFAELKDDLRHASRWAATYRISARSYEEAKERAQSIAVEQTVECPLSLIEGTYIAEQIVGQIEEIKSGGSDAYYAVISYSSDAVGGEFTELLNMLFGNTSLQPGIRLMSFHLPDSLYRRYEGPRFGRSGLRRLCGVSEGPILMSAVKPLGKSASELAHMVYQLAMGGCPLIKDDHSLYNQSYAPFSERVAASAEAVKEANAKTGGQSRYIANCTADGSEFLKRAYLAKEWGADGIMAAPGLIGFSLIRELAASEDFSLPIFLHPCLSGGLTLSDSHGISPFCYYGQLSRLVGADAVIFTAYGGRFSFSEETCRRICNGTEEYMSDLKSIFPIPSGGMTRQLFPESLRLYGEDTIFLVGGALQTEGPDLTENTKRFLSALEAARV